nr:hypothetical protein [Tanacetum cinerariifolium]
MCDKDCDQSGVVLGDLLFVDDQHAIAEDDLDIIDSTHSVSDSHEATTSKSNLGKLEGAFLVNDASMKLVNPTKVEKNSIGTKKKPTSIVPKSPKTSAIRLLKPKATPTPVPSVKSSSKKTISSTTSSKKKIHSVSKSRQIAPISSSDVTSTGPKQLPTKGSEAKASTSMASQKVNERSRKATEKIKPTRVVSFVFWIVEYMHMLETMSHAGMGSFDINVTTRPHVGDL